MIRVLLLFAMSVIFFPLAAAQTVLDYDGHLSQAKSLITQGKYVDAVKDAEKAIAQNNQRWEAYVVAAKGYSSQQLYDDAIGMLQIALARAPDAIKPKVRDAI